VSFNYGQRHKKELDYAAMTARVLRLKHDVVDLTGITRLISNSALTAPLVDDTPEFDADLVDYKREVEVPDGHYAEDTMKLTVVPNRNMIMLSIAAGIAVNNKYEFTAIGVHAGDHFVYPDCRPNFINAMRETITLATEGFSSWKETKELLLNHKDPISAPFINWSKADIAYQALKLGVPLHLTWSCYKGGDKHCGRCGTCVERLEAIHEAIGRHEQEGWNNFGFAEHIRGQGVDQTEYEDTEFWKQAVREAKAKGASETS
jgi:7-cyano-7-deazaguanine synthase